MTSHSPGWSVNPTLAAHTFWSLWVSVPSCSQGHQEKDTNTCAPRLTREAPTDRFAWLWQFPIRLRGGVGPGGLRASGNLTSQGLSMAATEHGATLALPQSDPVAAFPVMQACVEAPAFY